MSEENVEIVHDGIAAFERGDVEGVLRHCDEDIVITQPVELPGASREQRGHRGVLEALAIWPEQWDDYRIETLRIDAAPGDKVFVTQRTRGRGKQSGVEVEMNSVHTMRRWRRTSPSRERRGSRNWSAARRSRRPSSSSSTSAGST